MFINRKLLNLAKGKEATILEMTFWYVCSALADAARLAAWALFFICIAYRRIGILSMALLLSVVIFTLLRRGIEHIFSQRDAIRGDRFKQTVRKDLFGKLFYLGPQFTDVKRCGELVDTVRQQVEWLKFYYVNYMPLSISIFIVGVLFSVYGFLLSPVIGLVILLAVFGVLISPVAFYGIVQKKGQQEMVENARFYSDCMDGLRGITTLKAFNINQSQRERIDKQAELLRKATMKNLIVTTANTQTTELCVSMGLYLPVVIGALLLPGGSVAWEQLLVLFVIGHAVADHSRRILGMWLRAGKGISGLDAIYEIIDAEYPYSLNASEKEQRKIECGDIRFDNITFSYVQEGTPVVKDINLILRQGTQTALVGASGSGKSTLARLLFGFYKPQSGRICIGNQELDASTVHSMQDRVTAIWQDSHIFSASCFDNIHLAKPGSTADEVYEAAKRANIHELISSLPKGYDTLIGSGGIELSGGEKQRIIIARAFLRDAPILILDEATSSLDRKNEAEIQECIQELSDGRTVLIIAHRLDTIRHADQICVMENGSIIECGTHDELMNHGSRYSSLMSASEEMEVI